MSKILENRDGNSLDIDESNFDVFMEQHKKITSSNFFDQSNEMIFFQALEETNLFYEYSLLYRVKSCSILDHISSNSDRMTVFREHHRKDEKLLAEYNA